MDVGQRIVMLRTQKQWSQRELAKRVDINVSVMNRIELGDRPIKDQELVNLANVLDVTTDYLLGRSSLPNSETKTEFDVLLKDPNTAALFEDWKNMNEDQRNEAVRMIKYIVLKEKMDK